MSVKKNFDFFIVSKALFELTEPIEESIRERNQTAKNSSDLLKDFWVINSDQIDNVEGQNSVIYETFKLSKIYKKLESLYFLKTISKINQGFIIIISTNQIFVDWMNLKIPNLEKLNNLFGDSKSILYDFKNSSENIIGISGKGKILKQLIKKDELWEGSRSLI